MKPAPIDIEILTEYGVTGGKNQIHWTINSSFKILPDDNRIKYTIVGKTEDLKAASTALVDEIRLIFVRAKACFGDKSAFVKNLNMAKVGNLSYDKLIPKLVKLSDPRIRSRSATIIWLADLLLIPFLSYQIRLKQWKMRGNLGRIWWTSVSIQRLSE